VDDEPEPDNPEPANPVPDDMPTDPPLVPRPLAGELADDD
jgi:hypothetical protein